MAGPTRFDPEPASGRPDRPRSGRIHRAVAGAIRNARQSGRITADLEPAAALALASAELADAAARSGDSKAYREAAGELRTQLAGLPLAPPPIPGPLNAGEPGRDLDAEWQSVVSGGPR